MLEIGVCAAPCWGIIPLEIVFSGPGTAHQRGSAGAYALPACCSTLLFLSFPSIACKTTGRQVTHPAIF